MARGTNLLHEKVRPYAERLVAECEKQGLKIKITDTLRTKAEQDALYAQGRTKPGNIVTNARYPASNHCWGIAFDFCRNDGQGAFNDNDGFFRKVGNVGKSIGLEWGGDWTSFKDKPHFEYGGFGKWRTLKAKYGTPDKFLGTSAPSGSSGGGSSSNLLKRGSRGDEVLGLQNRLNSLGYNCGKADGIFGADTEKAVKAFQRDKGLNADGIVGDNTRTALNATSGGGGQSATSPTGIRWVKTLQAELNAQFGAGLAVDGVFGAGTLNACRTVKRGARGNLAKLIQEILKNKLYDIDNIDGIFGVGTERAVKLFQSHNGLTQDGIVGKNTWKEIIKF